MKRVLLSAILLPLYLSLSPANHETELMRNLVRKACYDRFVRAVILVESNGNPYAVGKDSDYGLFQITPIRLKDYNQLTGSKYTMRDMFDPVISRIIFDYYSSGVWYEKAAREWNGGPNGMKKRSTLSYWDKVCEKL